VRREWVCDPDDIASRQEMKTELSSVAK
jgi:hypothetical protein